MFNGGAVKPLLKYLIPLLRGTAFGKRTWSSLGFALLGSLVFATQAHAGTYYIDFANGSDSNPGTSKSAPWRRAPGMAGFAATYTHVAGDKFIFKGGVTWDSTCYPWSIGNSGTPGNNDTYTVDQTWFTGGTFTKPTFDANHTTPSGGILQAASQGFLTFDNLHFTNYGTSGVAEGLKAIVFFNNHDITFSNDTFDLYCWIGLYFVYDTAGTYNNVIVSGNDISHSAMGVVVATAAANTVVQHVFIHDNHIHDFSSQVTGSVHGDGIHLWAGIGVDNTQFETDVRIYNNKFDGSFINTFGGTASMTAFIFAEDIAGPGWLIFNNSGTYNDTPSSQEFESFIHLSSNAGLETGAKIFNNSFHGTNPGVAVGFYLTRMQGSSVENNIIDGIQYCLLLDSDSAASGTSYDYNDWNFVSNVAQVNGTFLSWAQWQGLGFDAHGMQKDPKYSAPASDLHLQTTSPAIGAGINLSNYFTTDQDGNPRPSGSWTIGAYEQAVTRPAPPTSVSVTVQ